MRNIYLVGMSAIALALFGCALTKDSKVSKAENFEGKTGIIGVFRQPAYYCGEGIPHTVMLGGTSIVVKTENNAEEFIYTAVERGWEPHYVVIYGDHAEELEVFSHMLNIEVEKY